MQGAEPQRPTHIDLQEVERRMTEMRRAGVAKARSLAKSAADQRLVDAQERLETVDVGLAVYLAGERNAESSPETVTIALAGVLYAAVMSLSGNFGVPGACVLVELMRIVSASIDGTYEGMVRDSCTMPRSQGGNA